MWLCHLGVKIEAHDSIKDGEVRPMGMSRRSRRRVYPVRAGLREIPLLFSLLWCQKFPARHRGKRRQKDI
jgi:hypothetical protein